MRKYHVGLFFPFLVCLGTTGAYSQSCTSSNNGTVINLACGVNCGNVNLPVPDLKTTSTYTVTSIAYAPYAYTTPGGNELTSIYVDDVYSPVIDMGFNFCFYDTVFNKCVIGSNGLITFDQANASCGNSWQQTQPIPYAGGSICSAGAAYYPKASIMGVFTDVYPVAAASAPDRKIECRIEGTAPCRKFIASFYHVGMFGQGNYVTGGANCNSQNPSTFQIVLYESTGVIEVYIENKACIANSNPGGANAIMGVQNWARNVAVAAPGKNASIWTARNEAYRFVPSGGTTRFINSQMFTLSGSLVATATTSTPAPGTLELGFPNICPSGPSEQFVVRTTYSSCSDPTDVYVTQDTITVNKSNGLGATTTVANLNCTTGSSGSITVNIPAGNGAPPYQYSINGGPLQSSNIFNNLADGNYSVFVTDASGCSSTLPATITRTGTLGVGYTSINAACVGLNTGSITILPPSIYTPIQYSLNNGTPQTGNIFTSLAAGSYNVTVTDAIGCSGSTTIVITEGAGITATFNPTPTSCTGINNGTITVNANGGTLPYQYSINNGLPQNSNLFTGLAPGTYSIKVTDANGCSSISIVVVNPGASLLAGITKVDVSCNGGSNGSIRVIPANGTPPYQYSLDNTNWQTSSIFSDLTAGTYTVYYKDNNDCSNSQTVVINQPAALSALFTVQAPRCNGYNDGTITVTVTGGTPTYQYSLDNVSWQSGNTFNAMSAGSYTVYCKDIGGCVVSRSITINEPAAITGSVVVADASCNGGADGQITVSASGGTAPLNYALGGPPLQTSNIFKVTPGTYDIMIIDANACVFTIPAVVVGLTNNLSITVSADITICEGKSTQLSVASNATQFSWTQASSLNNATIQNPMASPTVTTQYIVTATFGQCNGKDTVLVTVDPAPVPDAGPDVEICYGQDYELHGSGGVQYIWTPPSTLSNGALPNPVSVPTETITYSLNVIDAKGCSSLAPDQVVVTVTPPIIVRTSPKDTVVFAGDQFQLLASSAATNYSWSPGTGLNNPFIPNPIITVSSDMTFTVTASTPAGCEGEATVNIKVFRGPEIYMPTGFTPNGDGKNDKFKPFPVGITKLNYFRVYNRWGALVYSTARLNEGWDGRIGGIDQPAGTFVWMVQGVARDGKVITKKGTVTLIR
jgi:gliding motility-associated-like protein